MVFLFDAKAGMTKIEQERIRHSTFDVPRPTGLVRYSHATLSGQFKLVKLLTL